MRWVRFIAEKIARPWVVGALYLVLLAVMAAGGSDENAQTLGAHADSINHFIRNRYSAEIFRLVLAIGTVAACIGAVLGALAGMMVQLRDRLLAKNRSRVSLLVQSLIVTIVLHAWCETLAMATTPALYVEAFYARGGVRRTLQVLAADAFGRGGVWLFGILLLAFYLAGPLRVWPSWPNRFRAGISGLRAQIKSRQLPSVSILLLGLSLVLVASGLLASRRAWLLQHRQQIKSPTF